MILDRNFAAYSCFSQVMRPGIFKGAEPILTKEHSDPTWMPHSLFFHQAKWRK